MRDGRPFMKLTELGCCCVSLETSSIKSVFKCSDFTVKSINFLIILKRFITSFIVIVSKFRLPRLRQLMRFFLHILTSPLWNRLIWRSPVTWIDNFWSSTFINFLEDQEIILAGLITLLERTWNHRNRRRSWNIHFIHWVWLVHGVVVSLFSFHIHNCFRQIPCIQVSIIQRSVSICKLLSNLLRKIWRVIISPIRLKNMFQVLRLLHIDLRHLSR